MLAAQCVLVNDYLERVREHIKKDYYPLSAASLDAYALDALAIIDDLQHEIHREYCEELRIESDI